MMKILNLIDTKSETFVGSGFSHVYLATKREVISSLHLNITKLTYPHQRYFLGRELCRKIETTTLYPFRCDRRSFLNRTLSSCCLTHLSTSWVGRRPLCLHSCPLAPPPRCRPLRISPPGCHSICCRRVPCRCSWLRCRTDPPCGCGSEGPQSASRPSGCC